MTHCKAFHTESDIIFIFKLEDIFRGWNMVLNNTFFIIFTYIMLHCSNSSCAIRNKHINHGKYWPCFLCKKMYQLVLHWIPIYCMYQHTLVCICLCIIPVYYSLQVFSVQCAYEAFSHHWHDAALSYCAPVQYCKALFCSAEGASHPNDCIHPK